jgi:tetratricopeptide (TPR) repeat protein
MIQKLFASLTTKKAIFIIVILGIIVYFNALFGKFVWDDESQIIQSPLTYSIKNIPLIFTSSVVSFFYRPVFLSFLTIIHSVFGTNVFFFHFFQLLIHITNTILVFLLFTRFLNKKLSLFLAVFFLIHPINVESVAYISAVSDPLFVMLGLASLHIVTKEKVTWVSYVAALTLMLLSLLTKEAGVLLLFMTPIYLFLFKVRDKVNISRNLLFAFIPLSVYLFLRLVVARTFFVSIDYAVVAQTSLTERLISIPKIFYFYISTFFLPWKLSVSQHWIVAKITPQDFYIPLFLSTLFFIALFVGALFLYKKHKKDFRAFLFFLLWFLGGMGFYLQIVPLDMTVAERWFYLPIIGLLAMIGLIVKNLKIRSKRVRFVGTVVGLLIILGFSIRTVVRNTNWSEPITLYTHDSKISDNFNIQNLLGGEYFSMKKYDEAIIHYEKSVDYFPIEINLYNLGNTYFQINNLQKAEEYYRKAINKGYSLKNVIDNQSDFKAHPYMGLAKVLLFTERAEQAKEVIEGGLKDYPNSGGLWFMLAILEYKLHNYEDALTAAIKAKALTPNSNTIYVYTQISNKQPIDLSSSNRADYRIEP